jgi:hypothetical protein
MSSWTKLSDWTSRPAHGSRGSRGGGSAAVHRRKRLDRVRFDAAHLDQPFSMRSMRNDELPTDERSLGVEVGRNESGSVGTQVNLISLL